MYFHHDWANAGDACEKPFVLIRDHVLLSFASRIAEVDAELAARLTDAEIERIIGLVPDSWLVNEPAFDSPQAYRQGYIDYLKHRLKVRAVFVQEAIRAHAAHV
uniref:Uncharacterized protein n=1 Tax=Panagrolaimus superbus TaxID=310955 RepID=A0A914YI33_9BILA